MSLNLNFIELKTKYGVTIIQLFPEEAPRHCEIIKKLIDAGFYNGLKWHRVIEKTLVQSGCPFGNGFGGTNIKIPFEKNNLKHIRGACSMARGKDINSASSQFFICLRELPNLNGFYTVWGQVIDGLEYLELIKKGLEDKKGIVEGEADRIYYMRLVDIN